MKKSFAEVLKECIRRLEASGEEIEAVLSSYPEQADELRPHLQVWASLSAVEGAEATPQGTARGHQRLLNALAKPEREEGGTPIMENLSSTGGFALKLIGVATIIAAIAIGITFLTGNLNVDFGSSEAEAQLIPTQNCLNQVLGNLAPPTDQFTFDDILAARDAFLNQDASSPLNRDGDGDIDIDDLMILIGELRTCFTTSFP